MVRAYVNRRAGSARILAAVAAGALIAGCGGGGSSSPPASTPPANSSAAPVVSSSGAGVQAATGSGGNGPTAGSVGNAPTGSFSSGGAGHLSRSSQTSFSTSRSESISSSQSSQIMSAAQAKQAQQLANQASHPATTTAPITKPPVAKPPVSKPPVRTTTTPRRTAPPVTPKTRVVVINHIKRITIYRTRTRIRTRTITRTITKTLTKTVAPQVPAGAYMPSKHPELAQRAFTVTGANIGCQLAPTGVRCGIVHRSWEPPAQPPSCTSTWGNAIALASKGLPEFSCGGSDPVNPAAKVIPSGWDTTLDGYTCQVRSFAVDCFNSKSNSGFTISRTGYSIY